MIAIFVTHVNYFSFILYEPQRRYTFPVPQPPPKDPVLRPLPQQQHPIERYPRSTLTSLFQLCDLHVCS
jgi:hypothetical protein